MQWNIVNFSNTVSRSDKWFVTREKFSIGLQRSSSEKLCSLKWPQVASSDLKWPQRSKVTEAIIHDFAFAAIVILWYICWNGCFGHFFELFPNKKKKKENNNNNNYQPLDCAYAAVKNSQLCEVKCNLMLSRLYCNVMYRE